MIQERVELGPKTTMQVGGIARYFTTVDSVEQLKGALAFARARQAPVLFLGGGSNVVIDDRGFDGLVVQLANRRYSMDPGHYQIIAGAAVPVEELVTQSTEKSWAGLEWAGGLPGTIGGAVRGNAGAFGGETKDSVVSVRAINPETGQARLFDTDACQFGYRTSFFKHNSFIIWEIKLQLRAGNREELEATRDANIAYRKTYHPQEPSVGSIFQNLYVRDLPDNFFVSYPQLQAKVRGEKIGAAALLEHVGMKGKQIGSALVSTQHANIIINPGGATARDIADLVAQMKAAVHGEFGIELREEPEFLIELDR